MRIFNETKTIELQNPDLEKGYLANDIIQTGQTTTVVEVKEQGHYEVEREYPNGGKDMRWVVDVQYVAPRASESISENIKVYIPFSAEELRVKEEQRKEKEYVAEQEIKARAEMNFCEQYKTEIGELNKSLEYLDATDYKAIQFAEGVLSASDFEPIKQQRQLARSQVRRLQPLIVNERIRAGLGEN